MRFSGGFYVIYDTHMKTMQYGDRKSKSKSFRQLEKKNGLESLIFHIIPIQASKSEGSSLGNIVCLPIAGHCLPNLRTIISS